MILFLLHFFVQKVEPPFSSFPHYPPLEFVQMDLVSFFQLSFILFYDEVVLKIDAELVIGACEY